MHTKIKGNIGQFATSLALSKLGYSVFTEEGDISKIDLIAELNGKTIKFQCKAITPTKGKLVLPFRKCGPGYSFYYTPKMFDYFSVYDLTSGKLYAVSTELIDELKTINLRVQPTKNNQSSGVHNADDFLFEKQFSSKDQ